jgi:hypothetical protein
MPTSKIRDTHYGTGNETLAEAPRLGTMDHKTFRRSAASRSGLSRFSRYETKSETDDARNSSRVRAVVRKLRINDASRSSSRRVAPGQ